MPTPSVPLLFPEALKSPGFWVDLGKTHGLTQKDFEWLSHLELATQSSRSQQRPPMLAESILLTINGHAPTPLAGSFVLSDTPDDKGLILYTPYGGIRKLDSRETLIDELEKQLNPATEDDDLLAFMSLARRKTLAATRHIKVSFEAIEGEVFEHQRNALTANQGLNDQALLDELSELPTLESLLDTLLDELLGSSFPGLEQSLTRVNFYATSPTEQDNPPVRRWLQSMSLSAAVLSYYRDQRWPAGQEPEFFHPKRTPQGNDQQHWETAVKTASGKLISLLSRQVERFWSGGSADGATRREFFARAIREQARADIVLKREAEIITAQQSTALHTLIQPAAGTARSPTLETVRLWEYQANYVELAGSLMISHANAYLYTPTQGLQVLADYKDLKDTLLSKFKASGHEDEIYGLLSLEERNRFIGFNQPQVTGEVVSGAIFTTLFEAIIRKQLQNLEYVLQVFRHSDGTVDIHALFDKALDIRAMISERLLALEANGRWSTRPVLTGSQQPSTVLADKAAAFEKTFNDVESAIKTEFAAQPLALQAVQQTYLANMKPRLAHALSVGLRGEANLRVINSTFRKADRAIVDTIFNPDQPERKNRRALNGFRPDAYKLVLECSGEKNVLPLANCVVLTERGGLDPQHSGRAILWTPAEGLEVFNHVSDLKRVLNQRLLDPLQRLALLENLTPTQRKFHRRYSLGSLRLIEGNVLHELAQSSIERFLAGCEYVRSQSLTSAQQVTALEQLAQTVSDTNLHRAAAIARAINHQQSLPAWLGMAGVDEQQLHIELLEQYRHNVTDDKDYLHGLPTLRTFVHGRLKSLLGSRFPTAVLDPDNIAITPNLALAGPSRTLTEFALNHVSVAQGTGFTIRSSEREPLPQGLDQSAIRQLLLSLDVQTAFAKQVTGKLLEDSDEAATRKQRFMLQLPWQLMQHAHALHLQQRLSSTAFDLIRQVLDMPDSLARASVQGAHALVRPLELIKTAGGNATATLGLYLIGPGPGQEGPQVLYTPYHSGSVFTEFENEASLVSAFCKIGPLQDLLIRRLPEDQRTLFSNLLQDTVGQPSEITLASSPLEGNLLAQLFTDNVTLISHLLGSQSEITAQAEWEAAKNLFSKGIKLVAGLLPGKLAYGPFLWHSYKHFKDSAEALQEHHWKQALQEFIAGAVQMVSLGRLSLHASTEAVPATVETEPVKSDLASAHWSQLKPTAPARTLLQPFEATTVALKDLVKNQADGTYDDSIGKLRYAAIAGKVYRVAKPGAVWRITKTLVDGPSLRSTPSEKLVIDPDRHTVHYGKAVSKMINEYTASREVSRILNIEAVGMEQIRARHPAKASQIVKAIDLARYYAFNSLHNLAQARHLVKGTRLDGLFKIVFDVKDVDTDLLDKIKKAITPICTALVDPDDDLMNTERFVVGSTKDPQDVLIAFVIDEDSRRHVHFTQRFFDQQLGQYNACLTEPFDVDGHAQAATLIHEFSHAITQSADIAYLEARRPFSDLISSITSFGASLKTRQERYQREALSLATPRDELFARWSNELQEWISLDSIPGAENAGKAILKITGCKKMADARSAFRNPVNADLRIDTILRNADSIAYLICQMGRQLDPVPVSTP
jgi:hypothetical protein